MERRQRGCIRSGDQKAEGNTHKREWARHGWLVPFKTQQEN
jgi:hypothetical protein